MDEHDGHESEEGEGAWQEFWTSASGFLGFMASGYSRFWGDICIRVLGFMAFGYLRFWGLGRVGFGGQWGWR